MPLLYHLWLSPFSRKVRIVLGEKGIDVSLKVEKVWERREDFLALNPTGEVPVMVEDDGVVLADPCKHGQHPFAAFAVELHAEGTLASGGRWRCVAAPPTYNPLGRTLTFLSAEDIAAAAKEVMR